MRLLRAYVGSVLSKAFKEYAWVRDAVFGASVNVATLLLSAWAHLIAKPDWSKNAIRLVLVIVAPYGIAIGVHVLWKIASSIVKLHVEAQETIDGLRTTLANQVVVSELRPGDPRIEAEFCDERAFQSRTASITLTNRGPSQALTVSIAPIQLLARTLIFPYISASIGINASERFAPDLGNVWGYDSHQDLVRAMSEQWIKGGNLREVRECAIPFRVDYEDERGTRFEARFELLYHGGYASFNPNHETIAECRNFKYRRIPQGVTPTL